jgi:hypothetical protein
MAVAVRYASRALHTRQPVLDYSRSVSRTKMSTRCLFLRPPSLSFSGPFVDESVLYTEAIAPTQTQYGRVVWNFFFFFGARKSSRT